MRLAPGRIVVPAIVWIDQPVASDQVPFQLPAVAVASAPITLLPLQVCPGRPPGADTGVSGRVTVPSGTSACPGSSTRRETVVAEAEPAPTSSNAQVAAAIARRRRRGVRRALAMRD